ncbi:MAG: 50S ribosomal protein L25 [Acidobacteriaceae bacterium]|nr:50S ribosomal protein L25 [Acidobacteriaceae bacterium]MBV9781400.1 50S ribosomal protein L25 [Acidobacteriaceae bacterium]
MRKEITVTAEGRDSRGKNEARRLRAKGSMPAVVYGGSDGPLPVAVNPKELSRILNSKTGHNTIFKLNLAGSEDTPVMIVDWQYDPIKDSLLHVDLKRIDLTQRITVNVPVVTQGDPKGVKVQGGLHEVVTREVQIECLPNEIPEQFVVDVSELMIGQSIRAGEIPMTGSIKLLSNPDTVISHVVALRAEEEPAAAATGPEAAAPAAEPEVIKKGKKEEEAAAEPPPAPKKK